MNTDLHRIGIGEPGPTADRKTAAGTDVRSFNLRGRHNKHLAPSFDSNICVHLGAEGPCQY